MPKVLIVEFMDDVSVDELIQRFDVHYDPTLGEDRLALMSLLDDTSVLVVRNRTRVDTELIESAPGLSVVARLGTGLDNIDLEACRRRGVDVVPATGANSTAVAEYVIGAMLTLIRGVFGDTERMLGGKWPRNELRGGELAGRRLGLLGLGLIGQEVAHRARAFGMTVSAHDPFVPEDDEAWDEIEAKGFEDLLETSDALSIHVPLSEETHGLIDNDRIAKMKAGTMIINTSRGGIVDEAAVIAALRSGHLGGAALDVFTREPLDSAAAASFREVPNLLLTPHIAGVTAESERRVGVLTVATVHKYLGAGE